MLKQYHAIFESYNSQIRTCINKNEELSNTYIDNFLRENVIEKLPFHSNYSEEIFKKYFAGESPFSGVKKREDLPDAFIFHDIIELLEAEEEIIFLCNDPNLSRSLGDKGIKIFQSVEAMLTEEFHENIRAFEEEIIETARCEIEDFLHSNLASMLDAATVESEEIPEENHEATISGYNEIENLEIGDLHSWKGGEWQKLIVRFECEVEVYFSIYRSEAYDTPSWVDVTFGDPEEDHYFEASGYLNVIVKQELSVKLNPAGEMGVFDKIELSGDPTIEVVTPIDT